MKRIAVVPIDNRPICYTLFEQISAINKNVKLFLPPRSFLGGLIEPADIEGIYKWLKSLKNIDFLIVSLDTLAYGGLVSSRRIPDTFEAVQKRLLKFKKAINSIGAKVFAFSSIMRISNNSINEEEKSYWNPWGQAIFNFSYSQHKAHCLNEQIPLNCEVPKEILEDYLSTRLRNFRINKMYLEWLKDSTLDILVYSKDDTGQYGWNVQEAETLAALAKEENLNGIVKTGADEIPLSLFTRALTLGLDVKVKPVFTFDDSKGQISKYEDISVENCVKSQLSLAGVGIDTSESPKTLMLVNNFKDEQGDLVLGSVVNNISSDFDFPKTPYFIADINNANGSDSELVRQMMDRKLEIGNMLGYSAYNTSANTIGSALAIAVNTRLALDFGTFNERAFKRLMAVRLLDDWAYQAHVRKPVREGGAPFEKGLNANKREFERYLGKISQFLEYNFEAKFSLPWKRSFEIEIEIREKK